MYNFCDVFVRNDSSKFWGSEVIFFIREPQPVTLRRVSIQADEAKTHKTYFISQLFDIKDDGNSIQHLLQKKTIEKQSERK